MIGGSLENWGLGLVKLLEQLREDSVLLLVLFVLSVVFLLVGRVMGSVWQDRFAGYSFIFLVVGELCFIGFFFTFWGSLCLFLFSSG